MSDESWEQHRLFIVESLKDLKTGQDEIHSLFQQHIKEENENRTKINSIWAILALIIAPIVSIFTTKVLFKP